MKKTPAGDFSDILAGLTQDGARPAPEPTPRAARPAAPRGKANAAVGRASPSIDEKSDRKPDAKSEKPSLAARFRRLLSWRRKAKTAPPADQPSTKADAVPDGRPKVRIRRLFGAAPWRSKKGFFSKYAFRQEPASGPGRAKTRDARPPGDSKPQEFRLPKTEDEAIAAELGLRADLASTELKRIRREFAKKNHPDRIAAPQRMSAARRMSIANMLIDEHLKKKSTAR